MLKAEGVSAGYGAEHIIRDISFALPQGHNLVILGPNGAGKTTLLRCMAGLLPFEGSLEAAGLTVCGQKPAVLARRIGLLSQDAAPAFGYTVYETVLMGRYVYLRGLVPKAEPRDKAAVDAAIEAVGIGALQNRPITELSQGQRQRVFLAQVLAQDPRLILLDEPTAHLDLKVQADILAHILQWAAAEGRAAVGVLHDIGLALQLGDYALLLRQGSVVGFGPVAEVVTPGALRETYGMDVTSYMLNQLALWQDIQARGQ